ncbi:MAG: thioredoxin domain-containing protein [Bdellovibrionota bacterium]
MKVSNISKSLIAVLIPTLCLSFWATVGHSENLYTYKGKTYSVSELEPSFQQSIYEAKKEQYDSLSHVVDEHLIQIYLEEKAKSKKTTIEKVREATFATKPASEGEMKAWYDKNKERIPYPYEKIKGEISRILEREKAVEIRNTLIKEIKSKGKFKVLLEEPVPPSFNIASQGYPTKGSDKAKLTLVEFADYQCPHCKKASSVVKNVMKKYGNKVKLVYLDFPINPSGISRQVAVGGVCADQQKKYWEYHYMAFEKQNELTKESPEKFAKDLGLEIQKFKECLASNEAKEKVAKSEVEGRRVGVQGTPTFFLNGRKIQVGHDEKQFEAEINKALKG